MLNTCSRRLRHAGTTEIINFKNPDESKKNFNQRSYLPIDEEAKVEDAQSSRDSLGDHLNIDLSNARQDEDRSQLPYIQATSDVISGPGSELSRVKQD